MVLDTYLPIGMMVVLAFGFAFVTATLMTDLLGPRRFNRAKFDAYECGIQPTPLPPGTSGRFPIKFYLTAMVFIIFDVEIIFLYPWAQSAHALGIFGLIEMGLFVVTVFTAYIYVWRRGGLDWD